VGNFGTFCVAHPPLIIDLAYDHMSVTMVHSASAHARLYIAIAHSDQMSVTLVHPASAYAPIFIDLAHSNHTSVTWYILRMRMRDYL
jgi:hypothetical protein